MSLTVEPSHEIKKPLLLILGHANHGKDTVGDWLINHKGYKAISSSKYALKNVIIPVIENPKDFLNRDMNKHAKHIKTLHELAGASPDDLYILRGAHRELWFDIISNYNRNEPLRLMNDIYEEGYDIYVGMRSRRELYAVQFYHRPITILWVDASLRIPCESSKSMTIEPWMLPYKFIIDNNGSKEALYAYMEKLATYLVL